MTCVHKYLVVCLYLSMYGFRLFLCNSINYVVAILQHMEKVLMPGASFLLNGKINIIIFNQPHFSNASDLSCISSMMRNHLSSCPDNMMEMCSSHGMVHSSETELVPTLRNNRAIQAPVESSQVETPRQLGIQLDHQYMLCKFPFHHHNPVPGSNAIHADIILKANSKKQSCGSITQSSKQDVASICPLNELIMINSETKTASCRPQALKSAGELSITNSNVSASHDTDDDTTVPNYDIMMMEGSYKHDIIDRDYENYPTELCNREEIPIVPEWPSRCGLSYRDTCYRDSSVAAVDPSNSPVNGSYCFTPCCFAAEKVSLVDEDSDYELNLSPTQEAHPQDISTIGSDQGSHDNTGHHDLITTPAESINRIDVIDTSSDSGGLADDGGATLLQDLPLEMAKQTDTEIVQVCSKGQSVDNTDDDFNGNVGKTQGITCSELPNQKIINKTDDDRTIESGKCFPTEQDCHNHVYINNLQAVPSYDQSLDDDGPSKLLMAMGLIERKDHHVPYFLNRWERIFTRSCYGKPNKYTMHCKSGDHLPCDFIFSFLT